MYYIKSNKGMEKKMFENIGIEYNGIKSVSPKESKGAVERGAYILDIREEAEVNHKTLDVPNAMFLPFSKLEEGYKDIPKGISFIVTDSTGMKSKDVARFLKDKGFDDVAYMAGGLKEWETDKLPLTVDVNEQITGSCFCMLKTKREVKKRRSCK